MKLMHYGYGFGMGWMILIPIILIVIIIIAVFKLFERERPLTGKDLDYDRAIQLLNERFAKGEIDEEEYNYKKSILTKR